MEAARSVEAGRRGGRRARREQRLAAPLVSLPTLVRDIPVYEVLDEEGLELIHEASMRILEETGIEFRDPEALEIWKAAGAEVAGERVRIDRTLVMSLLATTPEEITLHARNAERTVNIGGRNTVFVPTYGSPYVLDLDGERRYSTLADLEAFHKLAYLAPALHLTGGITCEPVDVAVAKRHLQIAYSALRHSDKPFMGATTARERAEDTVAMAKLVFGADFVEANTVMVSVCNCNSPLVWDATMLDAVKVYARHNQAVLLSPFVMADDLRPVPGHGLDEVRRTHGRHARDKPDELHDRPAGAALQGALALEWYGQRVEAGRRPGSLRISHDHAGGAARRCQLRVPFGRLARGGPDSKLRQIHARRRADRDGLPPGSGRLFRRLRGRHGSLGRGRPRRPLSGHRPHPGPLPGRLLHA
jgi:hypothetical protein